MHYVIFCRAETVDRPVLLNLAGNEPATKVFLSPLDPKATPNTYPLLGVVVVVAAVKTLSIRQAPVEASGVVQPAAGVPA